MYLRRNLDSSIKTNTIGIYLKLIIMKIIFLGDPCIYEEVDAYRAFF